MSKPSLWARFGVFLRWINPWWQQRRYDEALDCFGEQIRDLVYTNDLLKAEICLLKYKIDELYGRYMDAIFDPPTGDFRLYATVTLKEVFLCQTESQFRALIAAKMQQRIDDLVEAVIKKNFIQPGPPSFLKVRNNEDDAYKHH